MASQSRVYRFTFERQDAEDTLVHAPQRLAAHEAFEGFDAQRELLHGERPLGAQAAAAQPVAATRPTAIETMPDGSLLFLDWKAPERFSSIVVLRCGEATRLSLRETISPSHADASAALVSIVVTPRVSAGRAPTKARIRVISPAMTETTARAGPGSQKRFDRLRRSWKVLSPE